MKQNYVENEDLIPLLIEYKKTCRYNNGKYVKGSGIMSEELGKMVLMIAEGISTLPKFNGYTWRQDMVSSAILTVCKYLHNFDVETSKNPFNLHYSWIFVVRSQNAKNKGKHRVETRRNSLSYFEKRKSSIFFIQSSLTSE